MGTHLTPGMLALRKEHQLRRMRPACKGISLQGATYLMLGLAGAARYSTAKVMCRDPVRSLVGPLRGPCVLSDKSCACLPVQALALQDVMGLLEGEVHCSVVSEASVLRITAAGAAADAAESGAAPSAAAPGAAASAKSGASAPGGQPRRFRVCDGQRQNNRALQPREWLAVSPAILEFRVLKHDAVSSCCYEGALHARTAWCEHAWRLEIQGSMRSEV